MYTTDEFVELACANASLTEDGGDAPIVSVGSGGAVMKMLRTIHRLQRGMWDPDVGKVSYRTSLQQRRKI